MVRKYNTIIIEYFRDSIHIKRLIKDLHNDKNITNVIIYISQTDLINKPDVDNINYFLDNLPIYIENLNIIIDKFYTFRKVIYYKIKLNNLPILLTNLFYNNTEFIEIDKIPFGCSSIYLDQSKKNDDYDKFMSNTIPIN